ncbi:hypothetical protein PRVXH_001047 [Proteinivorax hydrogeniformans]|uniref:Uncharacterized protein n=1 Tax=Proteinivorax hydrogeniformans TaxID=1826727 RepID=A0AAU8HWD1_9FIRM
MNRELFRQFLKLQNISDKGVINRVCWAMEIEEKFNINLDQVCKSSDKTIKLLKDIKDCAALKKRQKRNFEVGLLSYYEFYNNKK